MSQIVILDSNTLTVIDWYFNDSPIVPVTPGIRLPVPEGLTWETVRGVEDPSSPGTFTLVPDPLKVQARLDQAWSQLRSQRNSLLAACDWTALTDSHLSQDKKDAWFTYRQELRDLPEELAASGSAPTDPFEWPLRPGELPPPPPVTSSRLGALLEHAGVEVVQEPVTVPEVQEPVAVQEPVVEVTEPQ